MTKPAAESGAGTPSSAASVAAGTRQTSEGDRPRRDATIRRAWSMKMRARWRRILAINVRWRGELVRQSSLYALAVLGPFLLLGLFAVGFRFSAFRPTGILVTPVGSPEGADLAHLPYVQGLEANIDIVSITTDERSALNRLRASDVDMVIVLPRTPVADVAHGQRATLSIYVSVVNPLLRIALYNAVNQQIAGVNDEAVAAAVAAVQNQTRDLLPQIAQLDTTIASIKPTDPPNEIAAKLSTVQAQLLDIRSRAAAAEASQRGTAAEIYYAAIISETDQAIDAIQQAETQVIDRRANLSALFDAQQRVHALHDFLDEIDVIPARTIAIPFTARITNLATGSDDLTNFYGPAALALLLQHLAITLAALSLVQERQLGTIESLAVSPASAGEVLLGRYLFYGLVTLGAGIVLSVLLVFGLHVPFTGAPLLYLLTLALLIWASTAEGFCLALITRSDAQAMQSIMLLLVGAIFFSGFIGPLRALSLPASALTYVFPLTYAIDALDHIMLLGTLPPLVDFIGPAALGIIFSVLAWWLFRRELAPQ
jgi:ABC-2 type transport system permease protein